MKQIFTILFLIVLTISVNGQTVQKERKVVQVMTPQTFYLNGGTKATFGGKSRTWLNIPLPKNTVEWYYSFTTTKNENSSSTIGLLSQLTRLYDPTGMTAIATNAILTPSGAGVCDIYLMDRANSDKFMDKVDNWGGSYLYKVNGSRENYKNGTVQIKDILSGNWCLGFKNPSATEGISITFEVVAIIEETKIIEKTETETKAEMFGGLGWKAYEKGEYDKCIELSKKALELNPNLGWVHNNIGLVLLIKGDYISAIDSYSTAITLFKKSDNPSQWFNEAINDLKALIAKHGQLEGVNDILEILQNN
jgi:tetratricopeptide (TPR) repeat protein